MSINLKLCTKNLLALRGLKNYMNPSCIDLYLTNCPKSFESTLTIETGLSDFYKLYSDCPTV